MSDVPRFLKISGHQDLLRDTYCMGVVNTNRQALEAAKRRKAQALMLLSEDQQKDTELNTLKTEVAQLKEMVFKLLSDKG